MNPTLVTILAATFEEVAQSRNFLASPLGAPIV